MTATIDKAPDGGPIQLAHAGDGAAIAYRLLEGHGGARFALVHSLAMDGQFWLPVAALLRDAGDVLLVDCRGHGASARTGAPFTVEQFADDFASVLDVVGWERAVVAGASMGGSVALAFAASRPERTAGLGLFDTTASYGADAPARWEERARQALAEGLASLASFQTKRWFSPDFAAAHPDVLDAALDTFLANDVPTYAEVCRMLGRFDLTAALPRLGMPTRIVVGSADYATPPSMAAAMRDAIPGAVMEVLDGAAHLTPLERPADVARTLRSLAGASA